MYDALLGGSHNFEVDRLAAARATALVPDLPKVALSNRAFLRRAVRFLIDSGIRQFIDLGAGIPTVGSSHQIAQQFAPESRVAYVDIDPVAVAHAEVILADNPRAAAIQADARFPEALLANARLREVIDLDQPVGVLMVAVLHLFTDEDRPAAVVDSIRAATAPGSYLVISHLSSAKRPEDAARLGNHSAGRNGVPIIFRSFAEIATLFDGLTMVEPGLVELPQWRPETAADVAEAPGRSLGLAGVGRRD